MAESRNDSSASEATGSPSDRLDSWKEIAAYLRRNVSTVQRWEKRSIEHKDLWLIDLDGGTERRLTNLDRDVVVHDFDVSRDEREIVFDRVQENSDIVLIERRDG